MLKRDPLHVSYYYILESGCFATDENENKKKSYFIWEKLEQKIDVP